MSSRSSTGWKVSRNHKSTPRPGTAQPEFHLLQDAGLCYKIAEYTGVDLTARSNYVKSKLLHCLRFDLGEADHVGHTSDFRAAWS